MDLTAALVLASRLRLSIALIGAWVLAAGTAPALGAEVLLGTTAQDELVTVHSDSPWSVRTAVALRGLSDAETVIGLDTRASTGAIYAVTSAGRLLTVDPITGETRPVGAPMPTSGTFEGFSIDAQSDVGRIVTDSGANRRIDLDDGTATDEAPVAYAPGDPGAGSAPRIYAAAFTSGTSPRLYELDQARSALVIQEPVGAGALHTVGSIGFSFVGDLSQRPALALADDGVAYAALQPPGTLRGGSLQGLYRLDLSTGRATAAAMRPAFGASLTSMTAVGATGDDHTRPQVVVDMKRKQSGRTLKRRGVRYAVSCDEACIVEVRVSAGGQSAGRVADYVQPRLANGAARGYVQLNKRGLRLLRQHPRISFAVTVRVSDGAGNRREVRRRVTR